MNSVPQRQVVAIRSGLETDWTAGMGGRQNSCCARSAASAIRNLRFDPFRDRKQITKASYCNDNQLRAGQGEASHAGGQELPDPVPNFPIVPHFVGLGTYPA